MLKCVTIFVAIAAIFLEGSRRYAMSQIIWKEIQTVSWNNDVDVQHIFDTRQNAVLKGTPLSDSFLSEVKQTMMDCDFYNNRHAQFHIMMEGFTQELSIPFIQSIVDFFCSITTYLRAGVSFSSYAQHFPKYYRDYVEDDMKGESAWFWRDSIFSGHISTRVFHGNLESCPETLDLIKSHVLSTMNYRITTNATVFASGKGNIATPAHRHPQEGPLFVMSLYGARKFAIFDPECLKASWMMANNTFYPFEPFSSPFPFIYDYSCPAQTGTIGPGDILLTNLFYPHHFMGVSDDSSVISFFDKAYHPYETDLSESIDRDTFFDVLGKGVWDDVTET